MPRLDLGAARAWFDHQAYECFDGDPDSLDPDSWRPPRCASQGRGREPVAAAGARGLIAPWPRFLTAGFAAQSGMAAAFAA